MKFKIEKKDFIIFCIYLVILLYLCCILILNFKSVANDSHFHGLSPFEAFSSENIGITLLVFAGFLIVIFTSVTSYIFNKEKGMGIGLDVSKKSRDGYARWAEEKEIKAEKGVEKISPLADQLDAAGIPIISNDKGIYVDNGEFHNLIIGSTGSGKTETLVKPMVNILAKKGESMVITDPKGEIYKYTVENLKSKGYNVVLLNFREPQRGNSWNPLSLPYNYQLEGNKDKSIELLNDIALNILYEQGGSADPFWERTAADYFAGLTLGLFEDAKESEVNLNSINYMATIGEERSGMNGTLIKDYFELKGAASKPYIFASSTLGAPNETKGSILSTFRQKIRIFSSVDNLSEMLATSNFDIRNIGKEKTAVFMVIHDEKKTYHSLMTIFIKQCYEALIDVAQENGGKLKYRTNFILDEFANMPPLKDVDAMVSAARSRDIRFTFIIQNFAQLVEVYNENIAEVIKGNCGNLIYLISSELKALEEISKLCGEKKSKEKEKTSSTPLITISELQKLKLFQAIVIRLRSDPYKTQLKPNFKINWGEDYPEGDFPRRETKEVELFDIKKFVEEEKAKLPPEKQQNDPFKRFGMPGGMGSGMPGGMFGAPPRPQAPSNNMLSNMNIDEMMKDIDKKIKELEEQEKLEQENLEQENSDTINQKPSVQEAKAEEIISPSFIKEEVKEIEKEVQKEQIIKEVEIQSLQGVPTITTEVPKSEEKILVEEEKVENPKIVVDTTSKIVENNPSTDDEYFDDFFEQ